MPKTLHRPLWADFNGRAPLLYVPYDGNILRHKELFILEAQLNSAKSIACAYYTTGNSLQLDKDS